MHEPLQADETLFKQGLANLQRGAEAVGGRLHLTNQRLIFESHAFNFQTGTTTVALADIASVKKCWTKFLSWIPLVPNALVIETKDGITLRCTVFGREKWIAAIEQQRQG